MDLVKMLFQSIVFLLFAAIAAAKNVHYERILEANGINQFTFEEAEHSGINFTQYHRYGTIQAYLYELAKEYPDIVEVETIGKTSEKRDLLLIKIGNSSKTKKNILIDCGIHAREWVSPAFGLYIIQQLVENGNNRHMIENVTWHIIPVLNPDGYEYSLTVNPGWRKTRSCITQECLGVDPNRNFDYHWMESGSSNIPSTDIYAGPYPFSEPETQAFRDYALSLKSIDLYLAIHTNGQAIVYPWGWSDSVSPAKNEVELHDLATKAAQAIIAFSGSRYTVSRTSNWAFGLASGASDDWTYAVAGAKLTYTFELGGSGFNPPISEMWTVRDEAWEAMIVFHNYVASQ